MEKERITVGELIQNLNSYRMDQELDFQGLDFYRLKPRGDLVQFEFDQSISFDAAHRKWQVYDHG